MNIKFIGAAKTVTGSQTLIQHFSTSTLIDCGLFQGPKSLRVLNWETPSHLKEVKSIIITHAHIDHTGLLPRWCSLGWKGPIYCTPSTADLLKIMLMDSAKLQEEDAKFANISKHSSHSPALPLYTVKDAEKALSLIEPVEFNEWFKLSPHMSFKFLRAGHILGSAIVQVSYTDNSLTKTLTFSGDLGGGHSDIIREAASISETDDLVLESTYGNRKINFQNRYENLAEVINKVINRKGTLIIPAFALGRTQDLLYSIHKLNKEKKIPDVPVYLDSPMANSVTNLYLNYLEDLKFDPENNYIEESLSPSFFTKTESPDDSMMLCMSNEPKIVISASGMLQGGRVLHHLKHKLPDSKSGVLFVGFQGAETKGRLLQEGTLNIQIHHKEIAVEAEIFTLDGYSAHGDADDMLKWLHAIKNKPKRIFLNHGEPDSLATMSERIKTEFKNIEIIIPNPNESYTLEG